MTVSITIEAPRQDDLVELLRQSDDYALALYPPESCHLLDVSELEQPSVEVFVARAGTGQPALGIAALVTDATDPGSPDPEASTTSPASTARTAELKRMFVSADARGLGVASALLDAVENRARETGIGVLLLETGPLQPEAIALYSKFGFRIIPNFGKYVGDDLSVCMEKQL